jgi:hypothetical protein
MFYWIIWQQKELREIHTLIPVNMKLINVLDPSIIKTLKIIT